MEDFKPCPFCGGEYKSMKDHSQNCYIRLLADNFRAFATDDITFQHSEKEMDEAWNTRYEPTCTMDFQYAIDEYSNVFCFVCSNCEHDVFGEVSIKHCPNCGARVEAVE